MNLNKVFNFNRSLKAQILDRQATAANHLEAAFSQLKDREACTDNPERHQEGNAPEQFPEPPFGNEDKGLTDGLSLKRS